MVQNLEKYEKARDFRKRGFSYSEISKLVGVSKGTLNNWFAKKTFSKTIKKDNEIKARRDNIKRMALLNKAQAKERSRRYVEAARSAGTELKHYRSSPLFLTGLALYAAVGDLKDPAKIRLPSQRKAVHKSFQRFLRDFLGADKRRIYSTGGLTIFSDAVAKKKLMFWIDRLF